MGWAAAAAACDGRTAAAGTNIVTLLHIVAILVVTCRQALGLDYRYIKEAFTELEASPNLRLHRTRGRDMVVLVVSVLYITHQYKTISICTFFISVFALVG